MLKVLENVNLGLIYELHHYLFIVTILGMRIAPTS